MARVVIKNFRPTDTEPKQSFGSKVGQTLKDIIYPENIRRTVGNIAGGAQLRMTEEPTNQLTQSLQALAGTYTQRAQSETDPTMKQELLNRARSVSSRSSDLTQGRTASAEQALGRSLPEAAQDTRPYAQQGLQVGAHIGSLLAPGTKGLGVGQAGALTGALGGVSMDAESPGEFAINVGTGAALGYTLGKGTDKVGSYLSKVPELTGKILSKPVQGVKNLGTKLGGDAKNVFYRTFKPKDPTGYTARTGVDLFDDFVRRDAKEVAGMNFQELAGHFAKKVAADNGITDDYLRSLNKTVGSDEIIQGLRTLRSEYAKPGKVGGEGYVKYIDDLISKYEKQPNIPLDVLNENKRLERYVAKSAFGEGDSAIRAKAAQDVFNLYDDVIAREAPRYKSMNQTTQYLYEMTDSIDRQLTSDLKKMSPYISKLASTGGAMVVIAAITGQWELLPAATLATLIPTMVQQKLISPQYATKVLAKYATPAARKGVEIGTKPTGEMLKKFLAGYGAKTAGNAVNRFMGQ